MDPSLQGLLGNLRGRSAPDEQALQRLYDISPNFRITWTPARPAREYARTQDPAMPALWCLWQVQVAGTERELFREAQRRMVGDYRLRRYRQWPIERQLKFRDRLFQAEAMFLGYWPVGRYEEAYFLSEAFFLNLALEEQARRRELENLQRDREWETGLEMEDEFQDNPAFREYVNAAAREHYNRVAGIQQTGWTPEQEGVAHGATVDGREPELPDAGAGRERVGGPAGPPAPGGAAAPGEPRQRDAG